MQCAVLSTPFFDLCCAVGDVNVPGCVLGMERGFLAWRGSRARCATRCECSCAAFKLSLGVGRFIMNLSLLSLLPALVNAVRVKCSGAAQLVVAWCIQLESETSTVVS